MSLTIEYSEEEAAARLQATLPQDQDVFMVNPFDADEKEKADPEVGEGATKDELARYLKWTHTIANPYDPDFLMEVNSVVRNLNTAATTPHRLAPGMGVVERLDYLASLIQVERSRLEAQAVEYARRQQEIVTRYTEEQAAEWLKANMPQAYERVNRPNFGPATNDPAQSK